jgi:mono/diheme cytochrome c family protein
MPEDDTPARGSLLPAAGLARSAGGPMPSAVLNLLIIALVAMSLGRPQPADAAESSLTVSNGSETRIFTAAELQARPDVAVLNVMGDIYHGAVPYRAVPLLALLKDLFSDRLDTLEASARDGFVSQIPLALVMRGANDGAVAWIAVEDPLHPWPALPGKTDTAGPFYLVWQYPERSGVSREQWPYQVTRLTLAESPPRRWPQLALPGDVPAGSPAPHGQQVFLTHCIVCHRLNGGGASGTGPDLGRPMSPTQYFTAAGLRALIRNPRAVRTWPEQHMPGFSRNALSDADLDAIIAYLDVMTADPGAAAAK